MKQKRLWQSHLASCPSEPLNRLGVVVEPQCCPETPGAASQSHPTEKRWVHVHNKAVLPWHSEQRPPWWCYVKEKVWYLWVLPLFKWLVLLLLPCVSFSILRVILRIFSSSWTNGKWSLSSSRSPSLFLPQFHALISLSPSSVPSQPPPRWSI